MEIVKNIILVIISPRIGWDDVKQSCIPTGRLLSSAFLPMLAVLALAAFVPMLYDPALTISDSLITAIIKFSSYFVAYHLSAYVLGSIYPDMVASQGGADRMSDYIIYNLIYLVILEIVRCVLPVEFAPVFFLMFYMPYIAYKGTEYLGLGAKRQLAFTGWATLLILVVPMLMQLALNQFMK